MTAPAYVMQSGLRMMTTIDRFMTRDPYCVTPTESVARARLLMDRHHIHHLPVIDNGALAGTITARELVVAESVDGLEPSLVCVALAMRPAVSASPDTTIDEAVDLMFENELDCVIVRDRSGATIGIFTVVDALEAIETTSGSVQSC